MSYEKPVVLGASGPAGRYLTRELLSQDLPVRVVSRSVSNLLRALRSVKVDRVEANLLDAEATRQAVEGCDMIFNCVGTPLAQVAEQREIARNVAAAMQDGARCVYVSNYWSYLPVVQNPVNEDHPREGGNSIIEVRREAEDLLLEAGAAVLHLPDFFGPEVHTSVVQQVLVDAYAKRNPRWFGDLEVEREFIYLPDAMDNVLRVSKCAEAFGKRWIVPGGGPATLATILEAAEKFLSRDVYPRVSGPFMLRMTSFFDSELRAFLPMVPYYSEAIRFDGQRLDELLDGARTTNYGSAVTKTLYWIQQNT